MKRLVLLVVALVFAFTTTGMAQGKPATEPAAAEPAKIEKSADEKKVEKKAKAAYLVALLTVTNPKVYKTYILAGLPALKASGAEIVVAEYESERLEGDPGSITLVIKFPSKEAVYAWYNSPEYQKIKHLRHESTKGNATIAGEFDMAKNLRLLESPLFR